MYFECLVVYLSIDVTCLANLEVFLNYVRIHLKKGQLFSKFIKVIAVFLCKHVPAYVMIRPSLSNCCAFVNSTCKRCWVEG